MGVREGEKKKDKIVISKLSHALHDSLQTHCTTGPRGASKIGDQEISAQVVTYPQKKEELGSLSSLVVRMS